MDRQRPHAGDDPLTVLGRNRVVVLLCTLLVAGATLVVSLSTRATYEATASISFQGVTQDLGLVGTPAGSLSTPAQLAAAGAKTINRPDVLRRVRERLPAVREDGDLQQRLSTSVDPESALVEVTASARSAGEAAGLANTTANVAVAVANKDARGRYRSAAAGIRLRLRALPEGTRFEATRQAFAEQLSRFESLSTIARPAQLNDAAAVPGSPASPKPLLYTIVGALLGLLLGVGVAYARHALDRRLRSADEIESAYLLPLLGRVRDTTFGTVPALTGSAAEPEAAMAIAGFGILRRNVELLDVDNPPRVIAVVSAGSEEGKTTVATSLACAFASVGRRTLLIDCDLRRPSVAGRLGIDGEPGVTELLAGDATAEAVVRHIGASADGGAPVQLGLRMDCIPAGLPSAHPEDLLASGRFAQFVTKVRGDYDAIIVDTSPLLPIVDAMEILPHCDARLVCARIDRVTGEQARATSELLSRLPSQPSGLVVTGLTERHERAAGYEAYGYSYAAGAGR